MNSNLPLVSIFICTYNQEAYVKETLDSFLVQDCKFDFEIIIAEDHSKDRTLEICNEYSKKHPDKITILSREKNLGLINNFFQGITKCKGKYIAMCGGDDYWTDETKLRKQVTFLEENDDYVITYTDSVMQDNSGTIISNTEVGLENQRDFSELELQKGAFISPRTMVFRNILDFNEINYVGITQEDVFLISMLGKHGKGKYIENIKPSVYRILENSIWSSQSEIEKLFSSLPTYKRLITLHKNNIEIMKYFKELVHHNTRRALYKSIINKETKYVIKSYFICLSFTKYWSNFSFFLSTNKDFYSYFLFRKYK